MQDFKQYRTRHKTVNQYLFMYRSDTFLCNKEKPDIKLSCWSAFGDGLHLMQPSRDVVILEIVSGFTLLCPLNMVFQQRAAFTHRWLSILHMSNVT